MAAGGNCGCDSIRCVQVASIIADVNAFQSPFEREDLSSSIGDVIPADWSSGDRRHSVNGQSLSSADCTRLREPEMATTMSAVRDEHHLQFAIPFTLMNPAITSFQTTPTMIIPDRNEFELGRRSMSSPKHKADDASASIRLTSFPNVGSGRRLTTNETTGESIFTRSLLSTDLLLTTVATYMSTAVSSGRGLQQGLTFEKVNDKDPERCRSMTSQYDQYKQRTKAV